jgi:hypothetical protein
MSENDEIVDLLEENKGAINFLTETYNEHRELLDEHKLTGDLERLLAYVGCFRSAREHRLIVSMHIQEDDQAAQLPRRVQGRGTWSKTAEPEVGVESGKSQTQTRIAE